MNHKVELGPDGPEFNALRWRRELRQRMRPVYSLIVQAAFYSQDKRGIGLIVEFRNETDQGVQLLEWQLQIPAAGNVVLVGGPGEASFGAGAPWLERPPLILEAHRGTGQVAIFFRAPSAWRGELPSDPLRVVLKARIFPSSFLEAEFDVYSLNALREIRKAEFPPATATLREADSQSARPECAREVFSVHGIRTRGNWQKEVAPLLSQADFHPVPLDYGYFMAMQLMFPISRQRRIDWFRDEYIRQCDRLKCERPSIIAHSFGTYLLASAIEKYPQIVFDRVILSGSIIRPDFPWQAFISRGQVRAVMNQYGGRDLWVRAIEWVVSDAGPSGGRGFDSNVGILQQNHRRFGHSDYFYDLNYKSNWLPFLSGREPRREPEMPAARPNWKFRATLLLFAVAISLSLYRNRAAMIGKLVLSTRTETSVTSPIPPPNINKTPPKAVVPGESRPAGVVYNRLDDPRIVRTKPVSLPGEKGKAVDPNPHATECKGWETIQIDSEGDLEYSAQMIKEAAADPFAVKPWSQDPKFADAKTARRRFQYTDAGRPATAMALFESSAGKWKCWNIIPAPSSPR